MSGFHRPAVGTFFGLFDRNHRKPEMLATHRIGVADHFAIVFTERLPCPKNALWIRRNIYVQQLGRRIIDHQAKDFLHVRLQSFEVWLLVIGRCAQSNTPHT
jgi:hypothetical protein